MIFLGWLASVSSCLLKCLVFALRPWPSSSNRKPRHSLTAPRPEILILGLQRRHDLHETVIQRDMKEAVRKGVAR
jgi:hypothetical protein